jgi:hypothetical protein
MQIGKVEFGNAQKLDSLDAYRITKSNTDLAALLESNKKEVVMDGRKPIVVCGGEAKEAADMDAAQALAEGLAHSKGADAYILKPVKKVAPKRDVVTTDLP